MGVVKTRSENLNFHYGHGENVVKICCGVNVVFSPQRGVNMNFHHRVV